MIGISEFLTTALRRRIESEDFLRLPCIERKIEALTPKATSSARPSSATRHALAIVTQPIVAYRQTDERRP
ncbi:MAG TPA: hypothetical protein VGD41_10465 [Pyrinomonadaceae bacterium]|jgi:hypothetical protein